MRLGYARIVRGLRIEEWLKEINAKTPTPVKALAEQGHGISQTRQEDQTQA
jgi:tRNA nucleotidyltransferase/poly(A) polymerase